MRTSLGLHGRSLRSKAEAARARATSRRPQARPSFLPSAAIACATVVSCIAAAGCSPETPTVAAAPAVVTVSRPIVREIIDYKVFNGRLRAPEEVEVHARVQGYLDKVSFEAGEIVDEKQVLFEIDPRPFDAQLKAAQAQVAQWKAKLVRAQADVKRYTDLLPKGAASQQDLDRATADAEEARAMIDASDAAVDKAKLDLEFTKVTSPIRGRVSRALLTKGNLVSAMSPGDDSLLTTIVSMDPIYFYFKVDERSLIEYHDRKRKRAGDSGPPPSLKEAKLTAQVGLSTEVGFPHEGVLDFADNKVNPTTGTIELRGVLDNKAGDFHPGLFCRVRVPASEPYKAILVPERAVGTAGQGEKYVLCVKEDKTVEFRTVELGSLEKDLRVIRKGVSAEDRVIVNGLHNARPGATVDAQEAPISESPTPSPAQE